MASPPTLLDKQQMFTQFVARFIYDLYFRGYAATLGEAYRPQEMADIYAAKGAGIRNSNHTIRLAIDINLFYDGKLLVDKSDLLIPSNIWKKYSTDNIQCCWGGDFSSPDCDHFSFKHGYVE